MNKVILFLAFIVFSFECHSGAQPEVELSTILRNSVSVYIVEIENGKKHAECSGGSCYEYSSTVKEAFRGKPINHVSFSSKCRLGIGGMYLILLSGDNQTKLDSMACFELIQSSTGKGHKHDGLLGVYKEPSVIFPEQIPLVYRNHEICDKECSPYIGKTVFKLNDLQIFMKTLL